VPVVSHKITPLVSVVKQINVMSRLSLDEVFILTTGGLSTE